MSKSVKIVNTVKFVFPRPGSGTALASYSAAWLELTGLDAGGLVPSSTLKKIMGDTAYRYHCNQGNLEATEDGVKLTERGFVHFGMGANRNLRVDPEMVKSYRLTMVTGKPSYMVKNASLIQPLN